MSSQVYLSRDGTPNSIAILNLSDNTSAHQNIEAHCQDKNNMELVTIKNTDVLSTSISEESDQDLDDVASVDSHSLQDVLPYVTSGMSETDAIPMGTQFGLTHLNKSNRNHIGPKYIASHITVVNPVETKREESTIPVDTKRKCLYKVSVVTFIGIILVFLVIIIMLLNKWNIEVSPNETSIKHNNRPDDLNVINKTEFVSREGWGKWNIEVSPNETSVKHNNRPDDLNIINKTKFVSREGWGANPLEVKYPYRHRFIINTITITQTNTSSCNSLESCSKIVRQIQERDINIMHKIDIRYNFLIGGDGNIYVGRGWIGAYNLVNVQLGSTRVAFIGDYSIVGRGDVLSQHQKTAFDVFIKKGLSDVHIDEQYLAHPECCYNIRGSFVGYNLFVIYFNASSQIFCPNYTFIWKYKLCENKQFTT